MENILLLIAGIVLCNGDDHIGAYNVPSSKVTTMECPLNFGMQGGEYTAQDDRVVKIEGGELKLGSYTYTCQRLFSPSTFILGSDDPTMNGYQCWRITAKSDQVYLVEQLTSGAVHVDDLDRAVKSIVCNDPNPAPHRVWTLVARNNEHVAGVPCVPQLQMTYFKYETQPVESHRVDNDIWGCQGSHLDTCRALRSVKFNTGNCPTMHDFLQVPHAGHGTGTGRLACVSHFRYDRSQYQVLYETSSRRSYCLALSGLGDYVATIKLGACGREQNATHVGARSASDSLRLKLTWEQIENCSVDAAESLMFSLPLLLITLVARLL